MFSLTHRHTQQTDLFETAAIALSERIKILNLSPKGKLVSTAHQLHTVLHTYS